MSDEKIPAEIVRASDLKPGDHFTYIDCLIMADAVTHFHDSQCVRVDFHIAGVSQHAFWSETAFVARILPEPVEVREFWRVYCTYPDGHEAYEDYEEHQDAIDGERWEQQVHVKVKTRLIPTRAVITIRKEVQP